MSRLKTLDFWLTVLIVIGLCIHFYIAYQRWQLLKAERVEYKKARPMPVLKYYRTGQYFI